MSRKRAPTNLYAESEANFRGLSRRDYAEWVVEAFPWKTWGAVPWDENDAWKYLIMARAPGDPDRSTREERRARGVGYSKQWEDARRVPLVEYEKAILKATADGRPRTVQRIAVENFDMEASMLPTVVKLALMRLVYEENLAFAILPIPGYTVEDHRGRRRRTPYHVLLLWNDATWRRNHPGVPRTRRTAPMELPPGWEGQRPLRGTTTAAAPSRRIRQLRLMPEDG